MSTAGVDANEQHLCRLGCIAKGGVTLGRQPLCVRIQFFEVVLRSLFIRRARLDVPYVGALDCFLRQVSSRRFCIPHGHNDARMGNPFVTD
jgi:hypothetical protein